MQASDLVVVISSTVQQARDVIALQRFKELTGPRMVFLADGDAVRLRGLRGYRVLLHSEYAQRRRDWPELKAMLQQQVAFVHEVVTRGERDLSSAG